MASAVALVNQKGGVGKTTVTLGLASAAWASDDTVLVVDLDPQASATWGLGIDPDTVALTSADVLSAGQPSTTKEAIMASPWGNGVDVIPASAALAAHDGVAVLDQMGPLAAALEGISDLYDAVLFDCAPHLGALMVNALTAARYGLVVTEPSTYGLRGLAAIESFAGHIARSANPDLQLAGIVVNKMPGVSNDAAKHYASLDTDLTDLPIWMPPIPHRVQAARAATDGWPVHSYGAQAVDLADAFDHLWLRLRRLVRLPKPMSDITPA